MSIESELEELAHDMQRIQGEISSLMVPVAVEGTGRDQSSSVEIRLSDQSVRARIITAWETAMDAEAMAAAIQQAFFAAQQARFSSEGIVVGEQQVFSESVSLFGSINSKELAKDPGFLEVIESENFDERLRALFEQVNALRDSRMVGAAGPRDIASVQLDSAGHIFKLFINAERLAGQSAVNIEQDIWKAAEAAVRNLADTVASSPVVDKHWVIAQLSAPQWEAK